MSTQPTSSLHLGTLSGISLNLIHPYLSQSGKLYYLLDVNDDGISSSLDFIGHDTTDLLFNGGQDTYDTQISGAVAGIDDARTLIIDGHTLVQPTKDEILTLRSELGFQFPEGWQPVDYDSPNIPSATRVSSNVHYNVSFKSSSIYTNLYDGYGYNGTLFLQVFAPEAVVDTTPPTVVELSPTDEATGVDTASNIVLTFSEEIQRGTGQILLKTASGETVEIYDADTSANLDISGNTLSLNPSADLSAGAGYYVEFSAGSVKDLAGNGYTGTTDYNFSTMSAYPPQELYLGEVQGRHLHLISPYVTASGKLYYIIDANNNGYMDVQDHMDLGDHFSHVWLDNVLNGGADRFDTQPNGAVAGVDDARTMIVDGLTLVNPTTSEIVALRQEMNYQPPPAWHFTDGGWIPNVATATRVSNNVHHNVSLSSTTIYTNLYDGYYNGVWAVQVLGDLDLTPPTVTTFSPADEATGVAVGSNIVLTFSETIQRGTGQIELKTASGETVEVYDVATSANLDISSNTLILNPSADLSTGTGYKVEFAAGTVKDLAGNAYAGTTTYNFTTQNASAAAPVTAYAGHYYSYSVAPGITPDAALQAASGLSYRGLTSYLATISSSAENNALFSLISDDITVIAPGWASQHRPLFLFSGTDQDQEGLWRFNSGPEVGQQLPYFNWAPTEPNNYTGSEFNISMEQSGGLWADVVNVSYGGTVGYLVEFGGLPASFTITPSVTTVNEGGSVTFTIDTTNVEWGTALSYTLSGISQADLASGALTGTAVVEQYGVDGRAAVTVQLAADQTTEGAETLTLSVGGTHASVTVADTSMTRSPSTSLQGIAYHWKSHSLLSNVEVSAADASATQANPGDLFDLRALHHDAAHGKLTVEIWANPTAPSGSFDFTVQAAEALGISFTPALSDSAWNQFASQISTTEIDFGAFTMVGDGVSGPVKLGTLSVDLLPGSTSVQVDFFDAQVDGVEVPGQTLSMVGQGVSNDQGVWAIDPLAEGTYALSASRAVGDGSSTSGISSADALAALRIAVGLNPNSDPDGPGPLERLPISPYQIMAADVNGSGTVTSADALAILRMAVRLPNALPQEWMFIEETRDFWDEAANDGQGAFTLNRQNAQWDRDILAEVGSEVNLVGVLKGDVNGSWQPPAGSLDLDVIDPSHLPSLASLIGVPVEQWG